MDSVNVRSVEINGYGGVHPSSACMASSRHAGRDLGATGFVEIVGISLTAIERLHFLEGWIDLNGLSNVFI